MLTALLRSDVLRLTRFWNLVIIGFCQYATVGFLLDPNLLLQWQLLVLTSSTILVAAGGYVINDYYDVKIDLINKPDRVVIGRTMSRRSAILLHSFLSLSGVALGFLLRWEIGMTNFVSATLLWWYSNNLKRLPLVGNMAVAILTSLSVIIVTLLFPAYPSTDIYIYGLFAFYMTLVREIIKDMEDLKGDNTFGCRTLPIVWGLRRTKLFVCVVTGIFFVNLFFIHFFIEALPILFFFFFLILPASGLIAKLVRADTRKDFNQLSSWCKIIMLLGIASMAFI